MNEKLAWAFELVDRMTGNATKMSKALITVRKTLDDGSIATVRFQKNLGKAGGAAKDSGSMFAGFGGWAVAGATAVLGFAAATAYAAFEFAKFGIDALAFKESTLASFKMMLGTKAAARDIFSEALSFGKLTPFATNDVVDSYKQLMSAGFKRTEIPVMFQGLGDIAAAAGFNKEVIPMITNQLAQMKGVGKFDYADLKQIVNWSAKAGIGIQQVSHTIATMRGVTDQAATALIHAGQISADEGIFAFMKTIAEKGGGKVGQVMLDQSQTINGLFSTLGSAANDFFLSMDLDKLPGLANFKAFLNEAIRLLGTGSEQGQMLLLVLTRIVDEGLALTFGPISQPGVMQAAVEKITDALEGTWLVVKQLVNAGKEMWIGFEPLLEDFGPLLGGGTASAKDFGHAMAILGRATGMTIGILMELVTLPIRIGNAAAKLWKGLGRGVTELKRDLGTVIQAFMDFGVWIGDFWRSIGSNIGQGIIDGLKSVPVVGSVISVMEDVVRAARAVLQTHSPSLVFERIGEDTIAGFTQGVDRGAPEAQASTVAAIAPPQARSFGGGGGGQTIKIEMPIQIDASGGTDAQAVARALEETLPAQLNILFERLATEIGV